MNKKHIKKTLAQKLFFNLKSSGFVQKSGDFMRVQNEFYISVGYNLVNLDNSYISQFSYFLGFETIDKIYSLIHNSDLKNINLHSVHQTHLFKEKKYPILEFDLSNTHDAEKMAFEVSNYLQKKVLPNLNEYNTISKMERKVNQNLNPRMASVGLILAKLVDSEEFESLKQNYQSLLSEWPDNYQIKLEKTITFLNNKSNNHLYQMISNKKEEVTQKLILQIESITRMTESISETKVSHTDFTKVKNILLNKDKSNYKKIEGYLNSAFRQLYDHQIWNDNVNKKSEELYELLKEIKI